MSYHETFTTRELLKEMISKVDDGYSIDEVTNLILSSTSDEFYFDKYKLYPDPADYTTTPHWSNRTTTGEIKLPK